MNLITLTDSYKLSHFKQYPAGTAKVHSYLEARGGNSSKIVFYGLEYYLNILAKGVTQQDITEAEAMAKKHGVPFNKEGWQYIVDAHGGKLPLEIKALSDCAIADVRQPLMTVTNTDSKCFWLTNYVETLLMKVWYPISVATRAYEVRQILEKYWNRTADDTTGVEFAFHNFGDRGSSSIESAYIGGLAHLQFFKGTDNFACIKNAEGYSIPASEHSTVTSWSSEFDMYENYLETHKSAPIIACVLDSYNIYTATEYVTNGKFKEKVESAEYPTFVIRPDSGDPLEVIPKLLDIMRKNCSFTINSKGFRLFNKYRIIWGDGITKETIEAILQLTTAMGYSAENLAFGCGGYLMQDLNRDTHKMAIKCCAIELDNGEMRDVFKNPITDIGKKSRAGIIVDDRLVLRFKNGEVM